MPHRCRVLQEHAHPTVCLGRVCEYVRRLYLVVCCRQFVFFVNILAFPLCSHENPILQSITPLIHPETMRTITLAHSRCFKVTEPDISFDACIAARLRYISIKYKYSESIRAYLIKFCRSAPEKPGVPRAMIFASTSVEKHHQKCGGGT